MAELGQNLCSPARIYGPLPQTVFCGCSVLSFSVSAGWNEQASNLTVELVQDDCVGPRVWWDESLQRQTGDIADPGFTEPEPGCAVYFRIEENPDGSTEAERGGFEYAGVVESWTEKFDSNGNPVYTITITDPRVVLENTQIIVNDFPGTTSGVWNLINAYAYIESLGSTCTASPAGAIGGVSFDNVITNIANERGMVWNDLKCAIHTLTSAVDKALANSLYYGYCVDNRLVYVGPNTGEEGYGVIEKDDTITDPAFQILPNVNLNQQYYYVDLTEVPFAPLYYRISGPNISLMEVISQVCKDAGCDYYVELLPIRNAGKVLKVIKVRVAARSSQPQLGRIDDFITAKQSEASDANGGVLAYVRGEEVRNEETSTYLIGGKIREQFEADSTQMLPFWGTDTDGNIIQATTSVGEYLVRLDVGRLNTTLYNGFGAQYQWITESELRAAVDGDIDSWKTVTVAKAGSSDFATWMAANKHSAILSLERAKEWFEGAKPGHAVPFPQPEAQSDDIDPESNAAQDLDKVFEFVRAYADEFYGKQFIVNAPFVCYAVDGESSKLRYSHEPSTEGCWVADGTSTVIGLTHDSAASDFFRDDSGKYETIVRYPLINASSMGGLGGTLIADPSRLGDDNYITDQVDEIWVKAEVDSRWLFGTPLNPSASTISFVVRTAAPVVNRTSSINGSDHNFIEGVGGLGNATDAAGLGAFGVPDFNDRSMGTLAALPIAIAPNAALCPVLNHVQVYGPWGVAGLPGQVSLETDEGFVPWEYGSDVVMYQAALDKVASSVTQMRKGERGSIRVAGFPNIPLGAELFSVDAGSPPNSQGNQKYVGTRSYSTAQCAPVLPFLYCPMNAWTGEFGPNVTNINVQVGAGGFTTEYQFSTYTPAFGRFNKDNAERLRRIGQTRLQAMRNLRAQATLKNNIAGSLARSRQMIQNQIGRSIRAPKSAHHVFIGRYTSSGRPEIHTHSAKDAILTFPKDTTYANSAMISLDALYRPVSKAGDGSLPRLINFSGPTCGSGTNPSQPDPPINEYQGLKIDQDYLDGLANPNSTLPTDRSDTAGSGHDVEILGRGSAAPPSGWAIAEGEEGGTGGYETDYRFLALKGPVYIQQFGYDLCGKPVPNKADSDANAEAGTFTNSNLQDKFLDGFLKKPKTWPVAQLDLRLDRERGLWVMPQPPRNLHVNSTGCILISSGVTVQNGKTVYDSAGSPVGSPTLDAEWPWTIQPPSGIGTVPVYYDTVDCKHYVFPVNRLDISVTGGSLIQDVKTIEFGSGFTLESVTSDECINKVVISTPSGSETPGGSGSKTQFGTDNSWTGCISDSGYSGCLSLNGFPVPQASDVCSDYDCITVGRGLTLDPNGQLDSWMFINSLDACGRPAESCSAFNMLTIGTGLKLVTKETNCVYEIHSALVGSGRTLAYPDNPCDRGALWKPSGEFEIIKFIGNLHTTFDGCEMTVSGVSRNGIEVSGIADCNRASVPTKTVAGLAFGTGLQLTTFDCTGIVDINIKASGSERLSYCDSPTIPLKEGFEVLEFVGGLSTTQDGCKIIVSGIDPAIYFSGSGACGGGDVGAFQGKELVLGTGIRVTDNGDCSATISSNITATGKTYDVDSVCEPTRLGSVESVFENIEFIGNLSVTKPSDCSVVVSGMDSPITFSGQPYCGVGAVSPFNAATIAVSGMTIEDRGDCVALLKIDQTIEGRDNECNLGGVVSASRYRKLVIGSGLALLDAGDCEFHINSRNYIESNGSCSTSAVSPFFYGNLVLGIGFELIEGNPSTCEAIVNTYFRGSGYEITDNCLTQGTLTQSRFTNLKFLGNLSVTQEDGCELIVSGAPQPIQVSGLEGCNGSSVPTIDAHKIVAGTGLTVAAGSNCDAILSTTLSISATGATCYSAVGGGIFNSLILSGLDLVDKGNDCGFVVKHIQRIGKTDDNCTNPGGLGSTPEESQRDFTNFQELNIGEGLRLTDQGSCRYLIEGGIKIGTKDPDQACTTAASGSWYPQLFVGGGLTLTDDGCGAIISNPIVVGASSEDGSFFQADADCVTGLPGPTFACLTLCGGAGSLALEGPYCYRKPPKHIETLWAGFGIGAASCSECELILFNNHRDVGTDNSCNSITIGQVGKHSWSSDFALAAGGEAGGACSDDGFDNTKDTSITLNTGGGSWSCSFVKNITVTTSGGYVTDVTWECGSISGSKSCSGKYWITSTDCGCSGGSGGGGTGTGTGG